MFKKNMVCGLVMAALMGVGSSGAMAKTLRSADVHDKAYPTVMAVRHLGDELSKATSGKWDVKVFGNSSLGSEKDTVEQVKIGAIDMVRVNTAAFHSIVPESMILSLPFLFRDINHFRNAVYGPVGDKVLASFEKAGYIGLAFYESGVRSIYSKKPIRTLADVRGMKIRIQQSDMWVDLIKAMGASPIPIPYAEIYTGLKTNLIDASENNINAYYTAKHFESAQYFNETMHVMAPEVLVFSKKVWDTMTKEEQATLRAAAKKSVPYYVGLWEAEETNSKKMVTSGGTKFVSNVDRAEFSKAMKPVWDKYASTPELKALVQELVNAK
ncbi:MAG: C4-dicarboxylate transporter [Proteobacteria bacterium]|nr:C4-dicarboxylate transporter [Pseudomonadota bacterium]